MKEAVALHGVGGIIRGCTKGNKRGCLAIAISALSKEMNRQSHRQLFEDMDLAHNFDHVFGDECRYSEKEQHGECSIETYLKGHMPAAYKLFEDRLFRELISDPIPLLEEKERLQAAVELRDVNRKMVNAVSNKTVDYMVYIAAQKASTFVTRLRTVEEFEILAERTFRLNEQAVENIVQADVEETREIHLSNFNTAVRAVSLGVLRGVLNEKARHNHMRDMPELVVEQLRESVQNLLQKLMNKAHEDLTSDETILSLADLQAAEDYWNQIVNGED